MILIDHSTGRPPLLYRFSALVRPRSPLTALHIKHSVSVRTALPCALADPLLLVTPFGHPTDLGYLFFLSFSLPRFSALFRDRSNGRAGGIAGCAAPPLRLAGPCVDCKPLLERRRKEGQENCGQASVRASFLSLCSSLC